MKKKLSVSVGIPAYNEEANIRLLLERLLKQKFSPQIKQLEIIVISDGSTDKTVEIIKSVKSPLIKLIESKNRVGQQVRQNQLISLFKGDILVIIEADTLPCDLNTLNNLVAPFVKNNSQKLSMVVGKAISFPAKTLIEKIESHGMGIKDYLFQEWQNGENLYAANGHAMKALSKDFTVQLIWPQDVPEDSYTYLRLKRLGLKMLRAPNAKAYVKRAANLKDFIRRNEKFVGGRQTLNKYFPQDFVNKEFTPPIDLVIKHLLLAVFNSPLLTILYILESLFVRILNSRVKEFDPFYQPFGSTKILSPFKEGL